MEAVRHNIEQNCFELVTEGERSVVDYVVENDRMVITHTFVPSSLRGRGVAAVLVDAALGFARAHGMKVVPQCSYVDTYFRRHPEQADLRV